MDMKVKEVSVFPDGRVDARNAAAYVGLSEKTLAMRRSKGLEPKFIKRGRIFYFLAELDAWLKGGEVSSTAQARLQ